METNIKETDLMNFDEFDVKIKHEHKTRATWGKDVQFLMSCIAMSIGIGNIWRFPFAAYENGGGAFLIPYLIVLFLVGRPVYYMEMCLGQFSSKGNIKAFESLAPVLKGVGLGQLFGSICVTTYYCSVLAISLFYLYNSFTTTNLPWAECKPEWEHCVSSGSSNVTGKNHITSSDLFFTKEVLHEKTYIDDGIGWPDWKLAIFLFVSWFTIFAVSVKGIKSSGKVSYFLAIFPYVVMFTLLIRAVTLEGSGKGILYFLKPQWSELMNSKVWYNAVTQCFFSLNIGTGSVVMYSSYNKFKYNIYRDVLIISVLDTLTSLLFGITIFGILGNLAHELGVEVTEVVNSGGTRLAFITYPDAISKFSTVPWLFSILFFMMLFVLGIGSLTASQGCILTAVKDSAPWIQRWKISLASAVIGFLIGLLYITPGGQFILTLVDYFGATFLFFILTTLEVVAVFWWYGVKNFCWDVEFMLNRKVGVYWKVCWGIITPFTLIAIFSYFLASVDRLRNGIYDFPDSVLGIGWCLFAVGFMQIFIWWFVYVFKNRKLGISKAIGESFSSKNWGPSDSDVYEEWLEFKSRKTQEQKNHQSWTKKNINFITGK